MTYSIQGDFSIIFSKQNWFYLNLVNIRNLTEVI